MFSKGLDPLLDYMKLHVYDFQPSSWEEMLKYFDSEVENHTPNRNSADTSSSAIHI